MTIRRFYKADLESIVTIEESAHVAPWTRKTFLTCLQEDYAGWVVEEDKKIVGFIVAILRAEECHILNLCVARDWQHRGYGRKLLNYTLQQARQQGIGIAYLEVRRSNAKAIALYEKEAFQLIGERKGYYVAGTGHEDALIFAKSLQHTVPF